MFWLFRRKKVADKKAITPCICDNGEQIQDTFTLHDFSARGSSEGETFRSSRKGYQRLQGECSTLDEEEEEGGEAQPSAPQPEVPPQPPPEEEFGSNSGSTSDSSSECDMDYYFGNFTDTDDEDEELTCNVCERSFRSVRRLEQHQQRQRHYGCAVCDSLFPTLMALETHQETLGHWSEYELRLRRLHETRDSGSEEELEEHAALARRRGDELRRLLL